MAIRKAADPGIVERIVSFLSSNPLTQSWQETTGRYVVNPIEDVFARDTDATKAAVLAAAKYVDQSGKLKPELVRGLGVISNNPSQIVSAIEAAGSRDDVADVLQETLKTRLAEASPEQRVDFMRSIRTGRYGLTEFGDVNRQYGIGSPVAAYSAVTAGGALGTKAAMDLAAYLQAQQQAEKESELPLS